MNKLLWLLILFQVLSFANADASLLRGPQDEAEDPLDEEEKALVVWNENRLKEHSRSLGVWRWFSVSRRPPLKDIVDTAIDAGLSTLVDLVIQADLVDTLRGDGPFTVFAPTNAAFAALPASVMNTLRTNKDVLTQALLYHVVPNNQLYTIVGNEWGYGGPGKEHVTAAAGGLTVTTKRYRAGRRGPLIKKVNDNARVVIADVRTSNGVVQVIDSVLVLPQTAAPTTTTPTFPPQENLPTTTNP